MKKEDVATHEQDEKSKAIRYAAKEHAKTNVYAKREVIYRREKTRSAKNLKLRF